MKDFRTSIAESMPSPADHVPLPGTDADWAAVADLADPKRFLAGWLALLSAQLPGAIAALLLLRRPDGAFAPAALWPEGARDVSAYAALAERAIAGRRLEIQVDERTRTTMLACPASDGEGVAAIAIFHLAVHPGPRLMDCLRRIHWASGWLEVLAAGHGEQRAETALARSGDCLQVMAALEAEHRHDAALMSLCNQLAKRFKAERVTFGEARRGGVRVRAQANAAWFHRSTSLVHALKLAMTEAFHQRRTIRYPAKGDAAPQVCVAHEQLARAWNTQHVLSLCLQDGKHPIGVLTLERTGDVAFDDDEVKSLELVAALAAPVIRLKQVNNRLVSGRAREWIGETVGKLLGPRHPGLKLLTLGLALLAAALAVMEGPFRITAPAVIEGAVMRAAVAPFPAFVAAAPARAGMTVQEGELLARLDDRDLRFERLKWESERQKAIQRQREALAKGDRSGMLIAAALVGQSEAELALVDEKLSRTEIRAPIAGFVVSGDLSQLLGAPVEQGKVLFEIAPLEGYRLILRIPELDVRHAAVGQRGDLVLTGRAGETRPITLTMITSVSTPADGRNAFRAEATLDDNAVALRPGMEGVAKIHVGTARLLWVWTRSTVERLQLLAWSWLP